MKCAHRRNPLFSVTLALCLAVLGIEQPGSAHAAEPAAKAEPVAAEPSKAEPAKAAAPATGATTSTSTSWARRRSRRSSKRRAREGGRDRAGGQGPPLAADDTPDRRLRRAGSADGDGGGQPAKSLRHVSQR